METTTQTITTAPATAAPKKKLFVGIPMYAQTDMHFVKCFGHLCARYDKSDIMIYPHAGDSLICRARNHITRLFLETDCTHLLMIDSDLIFSNYQVERMLLHEEDLVGGVYCKKQEGDPQIVCNALGGEPILNERDERLVKVKYVGTGFIRISRAVFERMIAAWGDEMWYTLDGDGKTKEYDFWRAAPYQYKDGTKRYLSEDWWFCQKWMDLGGDVWLDRACLLKHSGNAIYPLAYQEKQLFGDSPIPVPKLPERSSDTVVPMSREMVSLTPQPQEA